MINLIYKPRIASRIHVVAPIMLCVAAGALAFCIVQLKQVAFNTARVAQAESHQTSFQVTRKELDLGSYTNIKQVISLNNPAITVSVGEDKQSLSIAIKEAERLPEFIYLLSTLQSYRPGLMWNAKTICMNKCSGGLIAEAKLVGYSQVVTSK
jgi:hypothetical protein